MHDTRYFSVFAIEHFDELVKIILLFIENQYPVF